MMFWIACFLTPFIAGLQRYAVSYGYDGVSRAVAWGRAWRVAAMVAIMCAVFAAAALLGGKP